MSQQLTLEATPHQCWFCAYQNPSYLRRCERCKGPTIPTRDRNNRILEWSIFSFGQSAPDSERSPSTFPQAMEVFYTQEYVPIRLGSEHAHYILVRYSRHGETFYSTQNSIQKENRQTTTVNWDEASEEQRNSLFRFVNENLDGRGPWWVKSIYWVHMLGLSHAGAVSMYTCHLAVY